MWTNIKKLILFLFGIVLVVFGNKAAIRTIFDSDEKKEEDKQVTNEAEAAVIEDEVPVSESAMEPAAPEKPVDRTEPKPEEPKPTEAQQPKKEPVRKTEPEVTEKSIKTSESKPIEPQKEVAIKKDSVKTVIETEKSEEATGTE